MNNKQIFKILEEFKQYIGFADYDIKISAEYKNLGGDLANVYANYLEKEIEIILGTEFKKITNKQQKNVLIHELVHGRISVYKQKIEKLSSFEEEDLVNDLTRGFERVNR